MGQSADNDLLSFPMADQGKVFISYARKDGAELAQRLQADLQQRGYEPWLDKQRIEGGASWTNSIEEAIDAADYLLALLTPGSYRSEICRAEQLRSLRKGKCVIPLMAQQGCDIPLHLEAKNYRDFSVGRKYHQSLNELLTDLRDRNGVPLKEEFRVTSYITVPPLPVNFVERPEAVAALRNALMADDGGRHVALTALQGMGGIGKTVLAQALCCDEVVQQAFPDGIIWVTIGKEAEFDALTRMKEVAKALGDDLAKYDNLLSAKNQYRTTLTKKAALIVVDDVWRSSDLEPFLAENSPRSRLLFTTRDASIAVGMGAREHLAELLSEEKSREVMARWAAMDAHKLPPIANELIQECGRLPLALSMVGAMVRDEPLAYWRTVLEDLRNADLEEIKTQFPNYPYTDVLRALQVSVDGLNDTEGARYIALAVLLEDMSPAPEVQQCLWGVDKGTALKTAKRFINLSLAQRGETEGSIKLHDLQLDYVRARWPKEQKEGLELIHGAMRLSSSVIAEDQVQFPSQMVGRLLPYGEMPGVKEFTERVADGTRWPWLRPLHPALHPPGTALIRTLQGHTSYVTGVAITPDGQCAVSAADDQTLRVWDLSSGRELRVLCGHNGNVNAVAVTPDGLSVVSASDDCTLKVWDLGSGRELRTFRDHTGAVRAVSLSGDGRIAVSASQDQTLKVWEVANCCELRTLTGHTGEVNGVALAQDGRIAVSTSSDQTLKVWEVASGRELRTLTGHAGEVNGVALARDGRIAVSTSSDRTLKVWEVATGRELHTLAGHSNWVGAVALSADGRIAVSASYDQTLKVWDVVSGRELHTLNGHSEIVTGVALSADGNIALSASTDKSVKVWKVESGQNSTSRTVVHKTVGITDVALSDDGRIAVLASDDQTLRVWDVASGVELRTLAGHSEVVSAVALSADGRIAISASLDRTLRVWEVASGRELHTIVGHRRGVNAVAISEHGRIAVSASDDQTLKLWDVASGLELRTLTRDAGGTSGLALSKDGRIVVSASYEGTLKVWDAVTGNELRISAGHDDWVDDLALDGGGRIAVSASSDHTLKVWEVASGLELHTLSGHSTYVTAVAVATDGQRAVSASDDRTVKLWNLNSGACLATFTCDGRANCCAYSHAARVIVAGDTGGHIHFLRLVEQR